MTEKAVAVDHAELTTVETTRLAELEAVVGRGLQTFLEVGNALVEIRDSRLYRAVAATFEDYCAGRWDISRPRAYELMGAAALVSAMADEGAPVLPANERQARELGKVAPERRAAVMVQASESTDGNVTTKAIAEAANPGPIVHQRAKPVYVAPEPEPVKSYPNDTEHEAAIRAAYNGAKRDKDKTAEAIAPQVGLSVARVIQIVDGMRLGRLPVARGDARQWSDSRYLEESTQYLLAGDLDAWLEPDREPIDLDPACIPVWLERFGEAIATLEGVRALVERAGTPRLDQAGEDLMAALDQMQKAFATMRRLGIEMDYAAFSRRLDRAFDKWRADLRAAQG